MKLGAMVGLGWREDPKRLAFTFSRYKFVAKMLNGCASVLEVGCGDATGSWIVAQHVGHLTAIDKDERLLASPPKLNDLEIDLACHDIVEKPYRGEYDAAFALDVLEHVHPEHEEAFLANVAHSVKPHGVFIVGMPSLESQAYASGRSKRGHINCKTEEGLRSALAKHCQRVFMFGMNDETLHTGFGPMCHYRLAVGVK